MDLLTQYYATSRIHDVQSRTIRTWRSVNRRAAARAVRTGRSRA